MSILRTIVVGAVATIAVLVGGSGAHALSTYTPGGGPGVNFVDTGVTLDVGAGAPYSCSPFNLSGSVISPGTGRSYGSAAVSLNGFAISGCVDPWSNPATVSGSPTWNFAVTGAPSGTTWPVTVGGVSLTMVSIGCNFDVAGSFSGVFNTASQTLLPTSSSMVISSVPVGFLCGIYGVASGQSVDVGGAFTNVPPAGSGPITIAP